MRSARRVIAAATAGREGTVERREEAHAKARVRAAAPELCAALREILASNKFYDEGEDAEKRVIADLDKCLKALAKARR